MQPMKVLDTKALDPIDLIDRSLVYADGQPQPGIDASAQEIGR